MAMFQYIGMTIFFREEYITIKYTNAESEENGMTASIIYPHFAGHLNELFQLILV